MNYQKYCNEMNQHKQEPMGEAEFNRMMGIDTDKCEPALQIRPKKNTRKVDATHKNYEALQ